MLNTAPRSTLHSAVDFKFPDSVHWFPPAARFEYSPSTALCAPQRASWEYSCHAGFIKARLSKFVLKILMCVLYDWQCYCLFTLAIIQLFQTLTLYIYILTAGEGIMGNCHPEKTNVDRAVNNYYIILNVSVIKHVHRLHYNSGQMIICVCVWVLRIFNR